jgi:hypothetical protein
MGYGDQFKIGYQPIINIIKDEKGNLLADPQTVLNRWKNFFNQVLSVYVGLIMLGRRICRGLSH